MLFHKTTVKDTSWCLVPKPTNHNHLILEKNWKLYIGQSLQQMMPGISDYRVVEEWS